MDELTTIVIRVLANQIGQLEKALIAANAKCESLKSHIAELEEKDEPVTNGPQKK